MARVGSWVGSDVAGAFPGLQPVSPAKISAAQSNRLMYFFMVFSSACGYLFFYSTLFFPFLQQWIRSFSVHSFQHRKKLFFSHSSTLSAKIRSYLYKGW
jgi:hypothetical protein